MANDSKYPSFEIADQAVTLDDMQISRGYWTYMGKEIRGKGLYKNVNNGQTYLFDAGDIQKIKEKSEMGETGQWPAEWNALVDRVNQDPHIEAFESTGPGGGALSRLRNLKTREEFTVAIPRDAMYRGRAYAFYTPDYTRRTGSKPASGTTVSVSQLIDFFNKSANNEIQENTMKLKNLLEQGYYKKQRRNPAADEYRPTAGAPDPAPAEWDEIMDQANNDPRYKVYSDSVLKSIKNMETGAIYKLMWRTGADEWESRDYDRGVAITADEIIAKARADVFGENLEENNMKLKNLLEQMDLNDPALMRARASKDQFQAAKAAEKEAQSKRVYGKQREALEDELWDIAQDLRTAYADRRNLVIDMEQEAEPEGGDVASEYGSILNTLDAEIEALKKRRDAIEARLSI